MACPERLELPTPRFEAWYSIQLSYGRWIADNMQRVYATAPVMTLERAVCVMSCFKLFDEKHPR